MKFRRFEVFAGDGPGAINTGFMLIELTPLDRLWQRDWHSGCQPPAKRPELK